MVILGWDFVYLLNSFNFGWGNNPDLFFINNVGGSSNLANVTSFIIPSLICTLVLWGIFWFVSDRGISDGIGKLSRILIPLLFIIMVFIFIYSFTLPGSDLGIKTLLTPDWSALWNVNMWLAAFGQVIFSLSIGQAMVYTYASYLPENSKLIDEVLLVVIMNSAYEVFIALGVFSILGYMSSVSSVPINSLITEGSGLIFVIFPKIFGEMGIFGHIMAPLLFLSILFAGFTSSFALFEPLLSSVCDKFDLSRRKGVTILTIIAACCSILFSTGIGSYMVEIIDNFVNDFGILILIGIQAIILGWFFGVEKVIPYLNELSSIKVGKKWVFIIKYILPTLLIIIWVFGLVELFNGSNFFEIVVDLIITLAVVGFSLLLTKSNNRDRMISD